jgi:hypothetical protein
MPHCHQTVIRDDHNRLPFRLHRPAMRLPAPHLAWTAIAPALLYGLSELLALLRCRLRSATRHPRPRA